MWAPIDKKLVGNGIVAFSGGSDSMALLHWLTTFRKTLKIKELTAVHIDHGLREESAAEAYALHQRSTALGVPFVSRKVQVASGASLEANARKARYAALEEIRIELNASWIATGHTGTDLAHTVLMRILRGTGPRGLAAIKHVEGRLVRPLLKTGRKDTENYCLINKLNYLTDSMNKDNRFTRVKIRECWSVLEQINPKIEDALIRLSSLALREREALEWAAKKNVDLQNQDSVKNAPHALLALAIKEKAENEGLELSKVHTDQLVDAIKNPSGTQTIEVPGRRLKVEYGHIIWNPGEFREVKEELAFDRESYSLREVHTGDRFKLKRLKGKSKRLSRLYIDTKVPSTLRKKARVLINKSTNEIAWAEHLGISFQSRWNDIFLTKEDKLDK